MPKPCVRLSVQPKKKIDDDDDDDDAAVHEIQINVENISCPSLVECSSDL